MSYSFKFASFVMLVAFWNGALHGQQADAPHPPDYPGVRTIIPGVFITPIPGAPFSGTVEILSKQAMPNGTIYTRRTVNHIARNSVGVIHNERRRLEPPEFQGEPPIQLVHIYDPQTRLSTVLTPQTHIARQVVLPERPKPPANTTPDTATVPRDAQNLVTKDLGVETIAGLPRMELARCEPYLPITAARGTK